jgi:demethylmenaquinone methyltransferase/2-methoxy-6-polyprenyl-1,4-benzoquinol methylase
MGNPRVELVHRFFSGTGPTYDRVVNLCTFGADIWWKKVILQKIPKRATRIMDQGCGTGILTFQIARKFPRSRIVGVELRDEYLDIAKEKGQTLKLSNVEFITGRAEEVLLEEEFDCIVSSYLAKYADLKALIPNNNRMLRDGGLLVMHDFTYPPNRTVAGVWESYFRLLQMLGNWKFPQWREIYYQLPGFMRETHWKTNLPAILLENGFIDIRTRSLTFGTSTIVTACKG